jgi:predicted dehydrogenase
MRCLVVGCGSIGERHIKNLQDLSVENVSILDKNLERLQYIKEKYRVTSFENLEEALRQDFDIVFVCTPPSSHISISTKAVHHEHHVFIEKPLSNNMTDVETLSQSAKRKKKKIFVGYNFRFQQGLQYVKKLIESKRIGDIYTARGEFGQFLPDWRPWQDYKNSYTAKKDLGGGIILDGSHELDYMRWFFGEVKDVFCFSEKISNLQVETEDVAEILIHFKNEILCHIHLDFIRPGYTRTCEIVGETGVIRWDFLLDEVKVFDKEKNTWNSTIFSTDVNDMYYKELRHVFDTIEKDTSSIIDITNGRRTLKLALAAKQSAKTHHVMSV